MRFSEGLVASRLFHIAAEAIFRMPGHPLPRASRFPCLVPLTRRTSAGKLIPADCSLESMATFSRSFSDISHRSIPSCSSGGSPAGITIIDDQRPAPACHAVTPPYFFFAGGGGGASGIGADAWSCTITQSLPRFSSTSVLRPSTFITSPDFGVTSTEEVNVAQAMFPFL